MVARIADHSGPRLRRRAPGAEWAVVTAALLLMTSVDTAAHAQPSPSPVEICLAANRHLSLGVHLTRAATRIGSGASLNIVAVGSSSTTGLWVLNSSSTYPEVMRRELSRLHPKAHFQVVNSGRIGDTITRSIARFHQEVLIHTPELIVWQLGTNDVLWGRNIDDLKAKIVEGVHRLKASHADVVLMDLQYAPLVLASSDHPKMQAIIRDIAHEEHTGLFSRFDLMRRSIEAGIAPGALVSWDGLHNSAAGYECIGKALARAIDAAAGSPE